MAGPSQVTGISPCQLWGILTGFSPDPQSTVHASAIALHFAPRRSLQLMLRPIYGEKAQIGTLLLVHEEAQLVAFGVLVQAARRAKPASFDPFLRRARHC